MRELGRLAGPRSAARRWHCRSRRSGLAVLPAPARCRQCMCPPPREGGRASRVEADAAIGVAVDCLRRGVANGVQRPWSIVRKGASYAQEELPHGQLVRLVGVNPCFHCGVLWNVSGVIPRTMRVCVRGACFGVPESVLHVVAHLRRHAMNGENARERRVVEVGSTKRESPDF